MLVLCKQTYKINAYLDIFFRLELQLFDNESEIFTYALLAPENYKKYSKMVPVLYIVPTPIFL
jgi:hypothetical protein